MEVKYESPNKVAIKWTRPSLNDVAGPIDGYKIRINEVSDIRRERRSSQPVTQLLTVKKDANNFVATLSKKAVFCTVEVALYSSAGLGPFSNPVMVAVRQMTTKRPETTEAPEQKPTSADRVTTEYEEVTVPYPTTSGLDNKEGNKDKVVAGKFFIISFGYRVIQEICRCFQSYV